MKSIQYLRKKMAVYFVVGSQDCEYSAKKTIYVVREAVLGGVGMIQFRDKGSKLNSEERGELAAKLQMICRQHDVLFCINDDVELAVRIQADGIHVGQDDMPLAEVRRRVGPKAFIGVSAGTAEEALAAQNGGADYIGVGAMYATASKADAGEPIGPAGLNEIRQAVGTKFPIVGIGGINTTNALPVLEAGADGVAVISAISKAESPREAASALNRLTADFYAKTWFEEEENVPH